jgi:N6-adenosine-specific RNA methylase IME4
VIKAWGFTYKTGLVWVKDKIGMGYWARMRHELLLIAVRGEMPTPHESARPDSVIDAPRGEHSAKPPRVYDIIDAMYPELTKIELFSRAPAPREKWSAHGNQSGAAA